MEDPPQKAKITAPQARALLPEFEASGLPIAEFARQHGIVAAPLYNERRSARLKASRSRRAAFTEVVVARADSQPRLATSDHYEVAMHLTDNVIPLVCVPTVAPSGLPVDWPV